MSPNRTSLLLAAFLFAKAASSFAQESTPGSASMSDEEKRRAFLHAREEIHTVPTTPKPNTPPAPKPKPKSSRVTPKGEQATPRPTVPKAESTPKAEEPALKATPEPRSKAKPEPASEATPRPKSTSPEQRSKEASPKPTPTPTPPKAPVPKAASPTAPSVPPVPPSPPPVPSTPAPLFSAPITIEKSGVDTEGGIQPAPPAGWFTRWKFLSKAVRQQIDRAPVQKRRWRYIVVHNSGTRQGNAKAFEYYHLHVRKMPNGLAYHFVIGNGHSSGDGEVEIGNRWVAQINGGHVHSDYLNNIALGICLVGDFNQSKPTSRQLEALEELTRYLRLRVGKIDHKFAIVKAHREINPPRWPTDCPGDDFPYHWLHGKFD